MEPESLSRLLVTLGLAMGAFLGTTNDRRDRWTWNLINEYLTPDNPRTVGWLPEKGGVLYCPAMSVFYRLCSRICG
jgi:hypothetical protein